MNTVQIEFPISNIQKRENYVEQFKRLKKALDNGFNLEAIFIEYTIIEDRTESILRHGGYWEAYIKSRKGHGVTIDSKIRYIQKQAENKKILLNQYFSTPLLEEILEWKEKRNRLIHALLKQSLGADDVANIAKEGEQLTKSIRTVTERYKRSLLKYNNFQNMEATDK